MKYRLLYSLGLLNLTTGCNGTAAGPGASTAEPVDAGSDRSQPLPLRDARAATPADTDADASDAATVGWCDALSEKMLRCDRTRECGNQFELWCGQQSKTNSNAFEKADSRCVSAKDCMNATRNNCRYTQYQAEMRSAEQRALAAAYCATCPSAGCEDSLLRYDETKGSNSVSDAYVAVWEFSDTITQSIRVKCTGTDAGLPGRELDCPRAFGQCAAEIYLNALPSCPN
jgi:hypothetical protein